MAWPVFDQAPNEFMAVSMLSLPSLFISSGVMTGPSGDARCLLLWLKSSALCLEKAFSGSNDIIVHCTKNAMGLGAKHKKVPFSCDCRHLGDTSGGASGT
jgi:hypothetical protein